jgi:GrpE protein
MSERVLDRLMVLLGAAVVGVAIFGAVLALAPAAPSPHAVATEVLDAAHRGMGQARDRLPDGGAALVALPTGTFEVAADGRPQPAPAAILRWLPEQTGATAVVRGTDGSWAAVSVPEGGSAVPAGLVAALVAIVGVVAMSLLFNLFHRPGDVLHVQPTAQQPDSGPVLEQRAVLVRGLVDLLPQLPDGLVWQAEKALSTVGVRPVVADGEPVDPQRHHVVGTEPPGDADRANTVARTVRPGYADGDRLVIHPRVVVYATDQAR